jgi:hypothetical protein
MIESKSDFQKLLDAALPSAKRMLEKEREFIPFGARLDNASNVSIVHGDVGVETPKSKDTIAFLTHHFFKEAKTGMIVAAPSASWEER